MKHSECRLIDQGFAAGSCGVEAGGRRAPACRVTLKHDDHQIYRLITSIHLSRPENYLSIYQSGCNFSCRKCHSWYFSKIKEGEWYTPEQVCETARIYAATVTLREPREKATAWHAHDSCRCCGSCVVSGQRAPQCPGVMEPAAIRVSPQGFGPARNIVAFTGGDVTCCPEFYGACARLIKKNTELWVLIETNGYGLTAPNLDYLRDSGVDAFWLDIKAYDSAKHKWLTGCDNDRILRLPAELRRRNFVLEVLSLYIPGLVEADELENIARLLTGVDPEIPFTLLAFFPEYRMQKYPVPQVQEMVAAYQRIKAGGLRKVRIGNVGIFARSQADRDYLRANVDADAF
ncbi:MAG: radical SAM protein [Desulfobacterales bacterium]|nr:MAG: radical SAM protein [Desulfobacterales bacterium]